VSKETPKISLSAELMRDARRAAWHEGYKGERDFSAFVEMVLRDWIDARQRQRKEKAYPDIPNE
jgi:hypothetical protein